MDLAKVVSVRAPYQWNEGSWAWTAGLSAAPRAPRFHVVAYDFGVKRNILRMLAERGCRVTVVPAQTPAAEVLALQPDGVFLSNGPGDPEPCDYAIARSATSSSAVPMFGICLGHQLLGLARRAHREDEVRPPRRQPPGAGPRHRRVMITSQNHGFAVDEATLPATCAPRTARCSTAACRASS
jgi:carbamoyl-phosphate synthase small subunit